MIAPMLAVSMEKGNVTDWSDWMMEEKYDGHRLVIEIASDGTVTAHTRERRHASGKNQLSRDLPPHLVADLKHFVPRGLTLTLDGELLAILSDGTVGTSTDVTRTDLQASLRFVAFDVLMTASGSCMPLPYTQRRAILEGAFLCAGPLQHVILAEARECVDGDAVKDFMHTVWDRGGEGLILKRKDARYEPGKRRAAFVKVKKLFTAVCTVVGFEATRGTVMNRGPFATVVLEDEHGHRTSVKTKDDYELQKFRHQWSMTCGVNIAEADIVNVKQMNTKHPALGRKLRIEYQDIAADGGYRHPRWDRWEDE